MLTTPHSMPFTPKDTNIPACCVLRIQAQSTKQQDRDPNGIVAPLFFQKNKEPPLIIQPTAELNQIGANDSDFTIAFWLEFENKALSVFGNGESDEILTKGTEKDQVFQVTIASYFNADKKDQLYDTHTRVAFTINNNTFSTTAEWTTLLGSRHYTFVKQGHCLQMYKSGELLKFQPLYESTRGNNSQLYIGGVPWASCVYIRYLGDVMIFNKALNGDEITEVLNAQLGMKLVQIKDKDKSSDIVSRLDNLAKIFSQQVKVQQSLTDMEIFRQQQQDKMKAVEEKLNQQQQNQDQMLQRLEVIVQQLQAK